MKDGSLIAHGETHELYHYPPNRFRIPRPRQYPAGDGAERQPEPGLVSVSGGGLINAFSRGGMATTSCYAFALQHEPAPRSATSNRLNATLTSVHWAI